MLVSNVSHATISAGNVPYVYANNCGSGSSPCSKNSPLYTDGYNIGIGSASPGQSLDIQGTLRDLGEILTNNIPATTTNQLYNNAGTLYFNGSAVGGSSSQWNGTAPIYYIGDVGIGTNSNTQDYLTVNAPTGGMTVNSAPNFGGVDSNTYLMLHSDGTNGSTTFTDSSQSAASVTANGTATISTGTVKYGTGSANLTTAGAYLSIADASWQNVSSGDFTLDLWVYPTATGHNLDIAAKRKGAASYNGWELECTAATTPTSGGLCNLYSVTNTLVIGPTAYGPTVNTWNHLALVTKSGTTTMYINGVSVGSYVGQLTYYASSLLYFAYDPSGDTNGYEYEDEIRWSNVARWSGNFTPPAYQYTSGTGYGQPTLNFSNNTTNLAQIQANSSNNSLAIINNGVTAQTISSNGNLGIGSTNPGQPLDVNGTIRTIRLTMSGQTPVSGYVLTATDSAGDTTWSASTGGFNAWTVVGNDMYSTNTSGNVGIGTTIVNRAALTVMNGNVGIGTWAPGSALIVQNGNVGIGTWVARQQLSVGNFLDIYSGAANTPSGASIRGTGGTGLALNTGGGSTLLFNVDSGTGGYAFYNGGGGIVTVIANNGNIGIGTSVLAVYNLPTNSLSVTGNASIGNATYANTAAPGHGLLVQGNIGIGTLAPGQTLDVNGTIRDMGEIVNGNVGIGSSAPGQSLDVVGTVRALSSGSCSYLYKCVGGVDAGVIQTSACNLCPAGSCTQMNLCG